MYFNCFRGSFKGSAKNNSPHSIKTVLSYDVLNRLHLVSDGSHDNAFGTVLVLVGSVVFGPGETRENTG